MKVEKTTKNTITKIFLETITTPETDFELYNDILGKKDLDEAYEEWGPQMIDHSSFYHNSPLKIDEAISILTQLKEKGANYVSIDHNCDHPDYTFEAFIVRRATEEDIQNEKNKEKADAEKKAESLRKQAEALLEQAKIITE